MSKNKLIRNREATRNTRVQEDAWTTIRPAACSLMWTLQASGGHRFNIRNQSLPSVVVLVPPWCHVHEAARWWAESDGYLYRNISFSRPASVHIKSLAHNTSLLSPRPSSKSSHRSNPHVEALSSALRTLLFTASQPIGPGWIR